jgi:hypothetical protein
MLDQISSQNDGKRNLSSVATARGPRNPKKPKAKTAKGTDSKSKKERPMNSGTYHYSAELYMTDEQKAKLKEDQRKEREEKKRKNGARRVSAVSTSTRISFIMVNWVLNFCKENTGKISENEGKFD